MRSGVRSPFCAADCAAVDFFIVSINGVRVCRSGAAGESRDLVDLTGRHIEIVAQLNAGAHTATIRTTDLSHAYVEENSAYSS